MSILKLACSRSWPIRLFIGGIAQRAAGRGHVMARSGFGRVAMAAIAASSSLVAMQAAAQDVIVMRRVIAPPTRKPASAPTPAVTPTPTPVPTSTSPTPTPTPVPTSTSPTPAPTPAPAGSYSLALVRMVAAGGGMRRERHGVAHRRVLRGRRLDRRRQPLRWRQAVRDAVGDRDRELLLRVVIGRLVGAHLLVRQLDPVAHRLLRQVGRPGRTRRLVHRREAGGHRDHHRLLGLRLRVARRCVERSGHDLRHGARDARREVPAVGRRGRPGRVVRRRLVGREARDVAGRAGDRRLLLFVEPGRLGPAGAGVRRDRLVPLGDVRQERRCDGDV